jgi:hypothetical protein
MDFRLVPLVPGRFIPGSPPRTTTILPYYQSLWKQNLGRKDIYHSVQTMRDRNEALEKCGSRFLDSGRPTVTDLEVCKNWRDKADLAFWLFFNETSYHNFAMLNALFSEAKITPKDYLRDPDILKKHIKDKVYLQNVVKKIVGDNDQEHALGLPMLTFGLRRCFRSKAMKAWKASASKS